VSAQNEAERLARAWIGGWNAGKPDEIPLARDFTHASPFSVVSGREKYLAWVKPLAARNVVSLNIVKTLGGDSESVIWFEMMTPGGLVQMCDWVETDAMESLQSPHSTMPRICAKANKTQGRLQSSTATEKRLSCHGGRGVWWWHVSDGKRC